MGVAATTRAPARSKAPPPKRPATTRAKPKPTTRATPTGGNKKPTESRAARITRLAEKQKARAPRDLKDPKPLKNHDDTKTRAGGQVCVGGVCANDVKQGAIADCYFVSSLAAVAHTRPNVIRDAVRDNGDGTYRVRLHDENGKPRNITVDGQLYEGGGGNPRYAKGTDSKELWVPLMEKAYAQMKGGYEAIGNGGSGGAAMQAITGKPSEYTKNAGTNADTLFAQLREATQHNRPIAANTFSEGQAKKDKAYQANGLSNWHVYTVLGAEEVGGERWVNLRNPWGSTEYQNPGYETDVDADRDGKLDGDDGVFRMRLADYQRQFKGTWINDPPPKPSFLDRVGSSLGLW